MPLRRPTTSASTSGARAPYSLADARASALRVRNSTPLTRPLGVIRVTPRIPSGAIIRRVPRVHSPSIAIVRPASIASPRGNRAVTAPRHPACTGSTDAMPPSPVTGSSSKTSIAIRPAGSRAAHCPSSRWRATAPTAPPRTTATTKAAMSRRHIASTRPVTIIPPARAQKRERPVARPAPKHNTTSTTGGGITPRPPSSTWGTAAPSTPCGTPP